jgi:hypothetical protein
MEEISALLVILFLAGLMVFVGVLLLKIKALKIEKTN